MKPKNSILLSLTLVLLCLSLCGHTGLPQSSKLPYQVDRVSSTEASSLLKRLREQKGSHILSIYPLNASESFDKSDSDEFSYYQETDGLQVFFKQCPFWITKQEQSPALLSLVHQFFASLTEEQQNLVLNKQIVRVGGMKPQSVQLLREILLFDTALGANATPETVGKLLFQTETKFRIRLLPEVFIASEQSLIGGLQFYGPEQINVAVINNAGLTNPPDWSQYPRLIIPPLPDVLDDTIVNINKTMWSTAEIAALISKNGDYQVKFDERLSQGKFFLSPGEWRLPMLIKALSIGLGVEFRKIGSTLYIGVSPVYRSICTSVFRERRYKSATESVNAFLLPRYQLPENQLLIKPFTPEQFTDPRFKFLDSLSPEQTQFVRRRFEDLPQNALVKFLTQVTFVVENEQEISAISFFNSYGPITDRSSDRKVTPSSAEFYMNNYRTVVVY